MWKLLQRMFLNKEQRSLAKLLTGRKTRCKITSTGYTIEEVTDEDNS